MTLDEDRLNAFWRFVAERHNIFVRRRLWKRPPPWTDDPWLQRGRFTEIYRDLDRATRWLTVNVLPGGEHAPELSPEDCAFNVLVYRRFCRPNVFVGVGGPQPRARWDWPAVSGWLSAAVARGERIFTGAFMLTNAWSHDPKRVLVVRHLEATAAVWPQTWADVIGAPSLRDAHRALLPLPGMGPFLAYEALIDLCNAGLLRHSLDSWAYIGPGALRGAGAVAGHTITRDAAVSMLTTLRDEQVAMLRRAGARLLGPSLTLENIEQALCEFSKHERLRVTGRIKRRFRGPNDEDPGLWVDLPAKFTEEAQWVK